MGHKLLARVLPGLGRRISLHNIELVISDDDTGCAKAIAEVFTETVWHSSTGYRVWARTDDGSTPASPRPVALYLSTIVMGDLLSKSAVGRSGLGLTEVTRKQSCVNGPRCRLSADLSPKLRRLSW